jgi:hypothetical protein
MRSNITVLSSSYGPAQSSLVPSLLNRVISKQLANKNLCTFRVNQHFIRRQGGMFSRPVFSYGVDDIEDVFIGDLYI